MAISNISPIDSDQTFESFIQSFMKVFDKHAPIKIKRVTRAVRGSDYSPAIELSEEKDKLV